MEMLPVCRRSTGSGRQDPRGATDAARARGRGDLMSGPDWPVQKSCAACGAVYGGTGVRCYPGWPRIRDRAGEGIASRCGVSGPLGVPPPTQDDLRAVVRELRSAGAGWEVVRAWLGRFGLEMPEQPMTPPVQLRPSGQWPPAPPIPSRRFSGEAGGYAEESDGGSGGYAEDSSVRPGGTPKNLRSGGTDPRLPLPPDLDSGLDPDLDPDLSDPSNPHWAGEAPGRKLRRAYVDAPQASRDTYHCSGSVTGHGSPDIAGKCPWCGRKLRRAQPAPRRYPDPTELGEAYRRHYDPDHGSGPRDT